MTKNWLIDSKALKAHLDAEGINAETALKFLKEKYVKPDLLTQEEKDEAAKKLIAAAIETEKEKPAEEKPEEKEKPAPRTPEGKIDIDKLITETVQKTVKMIRASPPVSTKVDKPSERPIIQKNMFEVDI